MQQNNSQFQEILDAAKEKRGDLPVDTMIVSSHLAQMRLFILRRGLEFFCEQDSYGGRRDFLKKIYDDTMLEMKLEALLITSCVTVRACSTSGRRESYQLLYFPKDSYPYRQFGEIDSVELIYSFAAKEPNMMDPYATQGKRGGRKKYIKLVVKKDVIKQTISGKTEFQDQTAGMASMAQQGQTEELTTALA